MKLHEYAEAYRQIETLLDCEDTDKESLTMALSVIEGEMTEKATNIAKFIQGMTADIDTIKAEEKRLADRRRAIENRQAWLKQYLQDQMEKAGLDKVKVATMTIALQNSPAAVEIIDEKAIPERFLTIIPQTYVVDKKRVADALKAGEEVPGAALRQGRHLRIR